MITNIDTEHDVFRMEDGTEFPLIGSDVTASELNEILDESREITKMLYDKYYGETDES